MTKEIYKNLVSLALNEDMPSGDLTTDLLQLGAATCRARIVAKEDLIFCGKTVVEEVFSQLSDEVHIKWQFQEGDLVLAQQTIGTLSGPAPSLLKGERVALNFLGRMSGIATLTRCFVKAVQHTSCRILDTRKTTPAYREIEKYAVQVGGGLNHRMNLSDAILIKENHVSAVGGLRESLSRVRNGTDLPIEVEVRDLEELQLALEMNVERILLDNMTNPQIEEALEYIPDETLVEASGGMTLDRVGSVAELGVDFISVGALTHSAPCADVSLLIQAP